MDTMFPVTEQELTMWKIQYSDVCTDFATSYYNQYLRQCQRLPQPYPKIKEYYLDDCYFWHGSNEIINRLPSYVQYHVEQGRYKVWVAGVPYCIQSIHNLDKLNTGLHTAEHLFYQRLQGEGTFRHS